MNSVAEKALDSAWDRFVEASERRSNQLNSLMEEIKQMLRRRNQTEFGFEQSRGVRRTSARYYGEGEFGQQQARTPQYHHRGPILTPKVRTTIRRPIRRAKGDEGLCGQEDDLKHGGLQNQDRRPLASTKLVSKAAVIDNLIPLQQAIEEVGPKKKKTLEAKIQEGEKAQGVKAQTIKTQGVETQNEPMGRSNRVMEVGQRWVNGALTQSYYFGSAISTPSTSSLHKSESSTVAHQPKSTATENAGRSSGPPHLSRFPATGIGDPPETPQIRVTTTTAAQTTADEDDSSRPTIDGADRTAMQPTGQVDTHPDGRASDSMSTKRSNFQLSRLLSRFTSIAPTTESFGDRPSHHILEWRQIRPREQQRDQDVAWFQKVNFYMLKGDVLIECDSEAERQMKIFFEEARRNQPSIIFFDEIGGLVPMVSIGSSNRGGTLKAICGDGHYHHSLSIFDGKDIPAYGIGFGDADIVELLKERGQDAAVSHKNFAATVGVLLGTCFGFDLAVRVLSEMRTPGGCFVQASFYWLPP